MKIQVINSVVLKNLKKKHANVLVRHPYLSTLLEYLLNSFYL
jgi:hypothetical protein